MWFITLGPVGAILGFVGAVFPQLWILYTIRFSSYGTLDVDTEQDIRRNSERKKIKWEDWEWRTGLASMLIFLTIVFKTTGFSYSNSWVVFLALTATFGWMSIGGLLLDKIRSNAVILHNNNNRNNRS